MTYKSRIADALLADKLDAMGAVLFEGAKAYRRSDGVYVVPITCLKP